MSEADHIAAALGIPPMKEQIAACGSHEPHRSQQLFSAPQPDGTAISRGTFDGAPADSLQVKHGSLVMDVRADGHIAGILIGSHYITGTEADWASLRILLAVDRAPLAQVAELPPEVEQAIRDWYALGNQELRRVAQTIGFAEWLRRCG